MSRVAGPLAGFATQLVELKKGLSCRTVHAVSPPALNDKNQEDIRYDTQHQQAQLVAPDVL